MTGPVNVTSKTCALCRKRPSYGFVEADNGGKVSCCSKCMEKAESGHAVEWVPNKPKRSTDYRSAAYGGGHYELRRAHGK